MSVLILSWFVVGAVGLVMAVRNGTPILLLPLVFLLGPIGLVLAWIEDLERLD